MEFVKQMSLAVVLACLVLLSSCASGPDTLTLLEVTPLPRTIVTQPVVEYEPVYSVMRIIEVSEVNGVQRFFIVRMGADRTGITRGVTGEIGEDVNFNRIIGNFTILEMQGEFFRSEINELTHRIGTNAHIRIQTGERIKDGR